MPVRSEGYPRICLFGGGRMAASIQALAGEWGVEVTTVFSGSDLRDGRPRKKGDLKGAEVGIDFSGGDAVLGNVQRAVDLGLPLVEGTTAWMQQYPDVEAVVLNGEGSMLHSANFSLGVNVLIHLVRQAADLFETAPEFDPWISEQHHAGKTDSPSGTALRLSEVLLDRLSRKDMLQYGTGSGPIAPNQLSVGAVRAGSEPGRHVVGFDGPWETLQFAHAARDRSAFAAGALRAAPWLETRIGIFTMDDVLADLLGEARRRQAEAEAQHE